MESVDLTTGEVTAYDWDDAGHLITTTVAGSITRLYQYSQDGDMLQADVDGLVTTFAYDGNGQRLQLSIAGEATTFLPDYSGRSNRVLFEQGPEETKHYLYGVSCLGEYVTDNATGDDEWRYYQRDGATLVRQTTNQTATITLAWTFSPEGGVVLGEEGPVTHLGCQDDAVYDWSTGLIFKGGRYFDPSLGIWLTGPLMIIVGLWRPRKRRKKKKGRLGRGQQIISLLLVLLLVTVPMIGCREEPPEPPRCDETETPGLPRETPESPAKNILFFGGSWASDKEGKKITDSGPLPSAQTPHFVKRATEVIPYPGSKQMQANTASSYDEDLLVIGYSAGADTALIYADGYMRSHPEERNDWNITGMALLGPTMSGVMTVGGDLDTQWDRIMDELLLGGTDIYWLDDGNLEAKEFTKYRPLCSSTGVLHKERRPDQPHYDELGTGNGTNDSLAFSNEVFNWFGITP